MDGGAASMRWWITGDVPKGRQSLLFVRVPPTLQFYDPLLPNEGVFDLPNSQLSHCSNAQGCFRGGEYGETLLEMGLQDTARKEDS